MAHRVILYDREGRVVWMSSASPGFTVEEFHGRYPWLFVRPADVLPMENAFLRVLTNRGPQVVDVQSLKGNHVRLWLHPCDVPDIAIVGMAFDIPCEVLRLSERQRQVCVALADFHGSKAAAKALGITRSTVDNHRVQIAQKIGIPPSGLEAWCGKNREWL